MISADNKFSNYLKKKGLKFTPERRKILEAVLSLHTHFDADQLYEQLRKEGSNISQATIYRTFPLLIDSGIIKETLLCQSKKKYEHIFGHRHHDHMICISCGKIIEFREEKIEKLQRAVCKKYGFHPVEHRLGIKGYCKECYEKIKGSMSNHTRK